MIPNSPARKTMQRPLAVEAILAGEVVLLEPGGQPVDAPIFTVKEQLIGLILPGQHVTIRHEGVDQQVVDLRLHALTARVQVQAVQLPILAEQGQRRYRFAAIALSGVDIQGDSDI